jgi:putative transposase
LHVLLQRASGHVNHKRVYRLCRQDGKALRLKTRKKRTSALRVVQPPAQAPHQHWSMDVLTDSLYDGRRFGVLTIVDTMTRASPAIEVDVSLPSKRVVEVLDQQPQVPQVPQVRYIDNGPEFVAKALDERAHRHGVKLAFSRPGTPTDTQGVEAFNGRVRAACLDHQWFAARADAHTTIAAWRVDG